MYHHPSTEAWYPDHWCWVARNQGGHDPGTFLPWLVHPTEGAPADRFTKDGRFVTTDGHAVADSWQDLTDGTLINPIAADEFGYPAAAGYVMTGVHTSGDGGVDCASGTLCGVRGTRIDLGRTDRADASWTFHTRMDCALVVGFDTPIYCVEQ